MLRFTRLCAGLAVGLVFLSAGCTGGDPPDDPASSASAPSASASASPSTTSGPPLSADDQVLLDEVRAEGRITVIVELKLPHEPDGKAEKKKVIAAAQDRLLSQVEPLDVEVQTRFYLFPMLTLKVDEAALRHLQESPLVDRVHENRVNKPHA